MCRHRTCITFTSTHICTQYCSTDSTLNRLHTILCVCACAFVTVVGRRTLSKISLFNIITIFLAFFIYFSVYLVCNAYLFTNLLSRRRFQNRQEKKIFFLLLKTEWAQNTDTIILWFFLSIFLLFFLLFSKLPPQPFKNSLSVFDVFVCALIGSI